MKNWPAAFKTELARNGNLAYEVFKIVSGANTYYLAENLVTISAWSVTAYPAIKEMGGYREGISGALDEMHVAEMTLQLLLQVPVGATTVEALITSGAFDGATFYQYLGLAGFTPQLVNIFVMRDVGTMDDITVPITLQDLTAKLEKCYIGTKVSLADWPNADPADVGNLIPIPVGSPGKYPAVCLNKTADYIYCASDIAMGAISKVWARNSGKADIDITAHCTRYTGQSSQQRTGYGSKAVVAITEAQRLQIYALCNITLEDPEHLHSVSTMETNEGTTNTPQMQEGGTTGYQVYSVYGIFNNSAAGNRTGVTMTVNVEFSASFSYDAAINLCDDSNNRIHTLWSWTGSGQRQLSYTFEIPSDHLALNRVEACIGSSNVFIHVELQGALRTIRHTTDNVDSDSTGITISQPDAANPVADQILIEGTGISGVPTDACTWLLGQAGQGAITSRCDLLSYRFDGVIREYKTALKWLNDFAFQIGARFALVGGSPMLLPREAGSSVKTISSCITEGGKRRLTRRLSDYSEIINRVNVLYCRDWTKTGDEAYQANTQADDATSQTKYGVQERPELFKFDFVTGLAHAQAVRDIFLRIAKDRHWLAEIYRHAVDLDLELGDTVALGLLGNAAGIVEPAELQPGNYGRNDLVRVTVRI